MPGFLNLPAPRPDHRSSQTRASRGRCTLLPLPELLYKAVSEGQQSILINTWRHLMSKILVTLEINVDIEKVELDGGINIST